MNSHRHTPRRQRFVRGAVWVGAIALSAGILEVLAAGVFGTALPASRGNVFIASVDASDVERTGPRRCDACHSMEDAFSHPVDVVPSMRVPEGLPLDGGRMTCTTCHEQVDHKRVGAGMMLRPAAETPSFCTQCHEPSKSQRYSPHASGVDRAHFGSSRSGRGSPGGASSGQLDSESHACMACHDGTSASDAGAHSSGRMQAFGEPGDHPIGVAYRATRSSGDEVRLVPSNRLDKRVRLFDNTVGCGSCHSVYSKQSNQLVMSNLGSKLCLTCHAE